MGVSTLLGVGPMLMLLSVDEPERGGLQWTTWGLAVAAAALVTATGPNVRAVLQVEGWTTIFVSPHFLSSLGSECVSS